MGWPWAMATKLGNATPDQIQAFQRSRDDFRSQAADDSLYLAIVGLGVFVMTYTFMLIVRPDYIIPSLLSPLGD